MKRIVTIGILICLIITLSSCGKNKTTLEAMSTLDTGKYQAIVWNDKTYVPYCGIDNSERGNQIGIINGDTNDQVYQYNDHPVEEWIISFYHSGEMDTCLLMREVNVTDIPKGIQSEYDWNNK